MVAQMLLAPSTAHAQSCNFSVDNVDFGSITPIDNQEILATSTFTATCSGNAGRTVKVCMSLGEEFPRFMSSGNNRLNYEIYSDAARTMRWGSLNTPGSGTPPALFIPLSSSASVTRTQTLFLRIFPGQQSAPFGTYFATFAPDHTGIQFAYGSTGICNTPGFTRAPFNVQASIIEECSVIADPLDFGAHGLLNGNIDASTNINVNCTPGTDYTVSLGNGQNGTSGTTRRMSNGTDTIAYGLFQDASRSLAFGSSEGTVLGGSGTGSTQAIPVFGRVPPQLTPGPGVYQDVVIVNVTY